MSSKIDGVPRELLERLQSQTELSNDWDEVQALLAAPVVERQPACKTCCDQGEIFVSKGAVEYQMLTEPDPIYKECPDCASPPAPVAVVMPERLPTEPYKTIDRGSANYKAGFNACIKQAEELNACLNKVKELNQ